MIDEDKVLHLLHKVHGPLGPNFETRVAYDQWGNVSGVRVLKDEGGPHLVISGDYDIMEIIVDALCLDMESDK